MKNIGNIEDCFGCGVCGVVCPIGIISLNLNIKGFYEPKIDDTKSCIDCGACVSVCAFLNTEQRNTENTPLYYSGWNIDKQVRAMSSSGGFATAISDFAFDNGYNFIGVRYNYELNIAEHYIATDAKEQRESMGSKYIQSYPLKAGLEINKDKKYVVVGTPCYIDSLRRFVRRKRIEHNFVLIDFFCHGVPSMLLWKKYLKEINSQVADITNLSFRSKVNGWGRYTIVAQGSDRNYQSTERDLFYKFFLGDYCLNKACHTDCRYKSNNSSADIRLGDFWGGKFSNNKEGVSAIIAFTEIGEGVIKSLNSCVINSEEAHTLLKGQMKKNAPKPFFADWVSQALQGNKNLRVINRYIRFFELIFLPKRVIIKFRNKK